MKKVRYDVKTSRSRGRTVSTKIARHLFIYSFSKVWRGGKKKKHLCVARGLGEVTAEIRV